MVRHKTICVTNPIVPFIDMLERVQEICTVLIIFENSLLLVAPRGYMVDRTGVLYSKGTCHVANVAYTDNNFKEKDLTLKISL